jgi:putative membrane protein
MNFLWRVLIGAGALWVVSALFPSLVYFRNASVGDYLLTGLVLGLANAILRPILLLLTLPLNFVTLGLFTFVVNAIVLLVVSSLTPLHTNGFLAALIASVLISFASGLIGNVLNEPKRSNE